MHKINTDKKWVTQKDGSVRKYVRIKDRSNPRFDSFVPTDCYRKEIINHDHVNPIVNNNLSVSDYNTYDNLFVCGQSKSKSLEIKCDNSNNIDNLDNLDNIDNIDNLNNLNNLDNYYNLINIDNYENLNNLDPKSVVSEIDSKVVKDYNAWQKNLISQFGPSLPDTQLRLKFFHDFNGFKYTHPDFFDLFFKHLHVLPVSISNTNSWFDLKETHFCCPKDVCPHPGVSAQAWISYMQYIDSFKPTPFIKCNPSQLKHKAEVIKTNFKVILPSKTQKRILFVLFEAHRLMYNETVNFINKNKYFEGPDKGKYITDFVKLRDVYLKDKKKEIENKLKFEIKPEQIDFTEFKKDCKVKILDELLSAKQLIIRKKNDKAFDKKLKENMSKNRLITIPGRILDQAINKASAAFKSAITNMEEGNTKIFRIRSIKQSKENKVFHLETNNFNKDGFFATILGHMHMKDEPYEPFDKIVDNVKFINDKIIDNKKIIDDIKNINDKILNDIKIINDKIIEDIKNINDKIIDDIKIINEIIINDNKAQDSSQNKTENNIPNKKRKFRVKNPHKAKIYFKNYEVTGDPTVRYDAGKDRFTILFPETIKTSDKKTNKQKDKFISLDAGLRTFLTGMSNDRTVEIGTNLSKMIQDDLTILDDIKARPEIPNRIKKKYEIRINGRIERRINELHWKTINYLTTNFSAKQHIILGNLSTKCIVKRNQKKSENKDEAKEVKKKELSKMMKRVAMKMSFYKFKQRLKYKCQRQKINLQLINEYLTSKLCSRCGEYNDVGSSKIYNCVSCGVCIDRDVNASKNIAMRGFYSEEEIPTKIIEKKKKYQQK